MLTHEASNNHPCFINEKNQKGECTSLYVTKGFSRVKATIQTLQIQT